MWYSNCEWLKNRTWGVRMGIIILIAVSYPFLAILYMLAPRSKVGSQRGVGIRSLEEIRSLARKPAKLGHHAQTLRLYSILMARTIRFIQVIRNSNGTPRGESKNTTGRVQNDPAPRLSWGHPE